MEISQWSALTWGLVTNGKHLMLFKDNPPPSPNTDTHTHTHAHTHTNTHTHLPPEDMEQRLRVIILKDPDSVGQTTHRWYSYLIWALAVCVCVCVPCIVTPFTLTFVRDGVLCVGGPDVWRLGKRSHVLFGLFRCHEDKRRRDTCGKKSSSAMKCNLIYKKNLQLKAIEIIFWKHKPD